MTTMISSSRGGPVALERMRRGVSAFLTSPASARPLALLRIGIAAVLLLQAFALSDRVAELYGDRGIFQRPIVDAMVPPNLPRVGWVEDVFTAFGVDGSWCLPVVFLVYVACLTNLLLGWRTCLSATVAWLAHAALKTSGCASIYGVDAFATIALFYCAWMPVGRSFSEDPTPQARLTLRALQAHLCIAYFASGLEKAMSIQWWNGEAIWRALMRPDLGRFDFAWLASAPWLAKLACWGTLALEIGYPFLVWPSRTRAWWARMILGLHAGIAVSLGLVSFSAVMGVLTLAAFLIDRDRADC
jgi:hypothetical protein